MRSRLTITMLVSVLVVGPAWSTAATAQELSNEAQRVVDYLLQDWQRQFSSTTIPHAMEYLGMRVDDDLRLAVVEHLRANDSLARNLQWWGANNYLFTNFEKRVAKYLVYRVEHELPIAGVTAAAADLATDPETLAATLPFMAAAGFLQPNGAAALGFELAPGYKRWAGPLQHNFHTVFIEGEQPLDVW